MPRFCAVTKLLVVAGYWMVEESLRRSVADRDVRDFSMLAFQTSGVEGHLGSVDSKRFFTIVFPNDRLAMPLAVSDIQIRGTA